MFLAKVKVVVAAVLLVAALGIAGVAYRTETAWAGQAEQASKAKPRSELEALRHENELLRLNLEVVLEKVRAQEAQLRDQREKAQAAQLRAQKQDYVRAITLVPTKVWGTVRLVPEDATKHAETALKALREAKDDQSRRQAVDALDQAVRGLRKQLPPVPPADPKRPPQGKE